MTTALELLNLTELYKLARGEVGRPLSPAVLRAEGVLLGLRAKRAAGGLTEAEWPQLRRAALVVSDALRANGLRDVLGVAADLASEAAWASEQAA